MLRNALKILVAFALTISVFAKGEILISVNLSPAGSFEIKSEKVKGSAKRAGSGFITKGISVKTKTLLTGLELRDRHLHDKLEEKNFKKIEILEGKASGGKGVAVIQVKDIKKKIGFKYKESGSNLIVNFALSLKDFKFTGINYAGVGVKDKLSVKAIIPIK